MRWGEGAWESRGLWGAPFPSPLSATICSSGTLHPEAFLSAVLAVLAWWPLWGHLLKQRVWLGQVSFDPYLPRPSPTPEV